MENASLLSPADVGVIRRYVQTKYAQLPGAKQAEIVATAIRQTIHRRLPEMPDGLKGQIADELIRRCLVREQREIQPNDVLDVCSEIELPDPSQEAMILDPVLRWMNERAPGEWPPERLMSRLFRKDSAALDTEFRTDRGVAAVALLDTKTDRHAPEGTKLRTKMPQAAWAMAALVLAGGIVSGVYIQQDRTTREPVVPSPSPVVEEPATEDDIGMPRILRYRDIDEDAVKAYLRSRDSILADEPYYNAIIEGARRHDVNPLLLLAVTGQEQGFVPKSNKNAKKIANNPFNVFHSWEEFNTDIADSADIAARTLSRQGAKRPKGFEPFDWLNQTYAEDPNWSDGVKRIFDKLSRLPPSSGTP
ncbi:hypothetical protein GE107_18955 [Cohnella sp. CFH 77786]|uniref:hypothetical protein n=1 Tax=Cohnella sp. CFH 77786 TaxID=2662265 RepID=UPI001C60CA4A|nr:hypothetical protein [Cohnella sp. CFH 77786]MBW5448141.1 hypothetical protein [Cohnella sp. CFH 77786]